MKDDVLNTWMDFIGLLRGFIIFSLFGSVSAPITQVNGAQGCPVYLTLDRDPTNAQVLWRMEKQASSDIIAEIDNRNEKEPNYNNSYEERCKLFKNGTLKLERIEYSDQGTYIANVIDLENFQFWTAEYELHVHPYLLAPILKSVNQTFLNGTNDSLQCDAGVQNVTSYTFYRNNSESICSKPHVICRGAFLYFTPITENDGGAYTCAIQNPGSSNTSDSLNVSVSWYPEGNIRCTAQPKGNKTNVGCSWPGGQPPANVTIFYTVMSNERFYNKIVQEVNEVTKGSNLTCTGTQLGRNSSCILIFEPPQCPQHNKNSEIHVTEGETAILTLNLQSETQSTNGPLVQVLPANFSWFYDEDFIPIKTDGKFMVTANEDFSSLCIFRVTIMESGQYFCRVENLIGSQDFNFTLNVESQELNIDVIAGIVIGVLVGLIVAGVVIYFILKRKQVKPKALVQEKRNPPQSHIYENTQPGAKQLQYQEESLYCNVLAGRKN